MTWSQRISDLFSVATAVLVSIGGAGGVLMLLSSWLGKVWAERILGREKADLTKSIETIKAELTRSIEREKAEMARLHEAHRSQLQELSTQRIDALNRKRDVYTPLATKMRVLLRADMTPEQQRQDKWAFLAAYDQGYIWSSEPVIAAIRDLIETVERKTAADVNASLTPPNSPVAAEVRATAQALDIRAAELYRRCLLEMRRDSGFPDSAAEYRVVTFK
jgi:hypothetical protein